LSGPTRILGCDYGERRTGVAVSDATCSIAFPAGVVEARTVAEAARRVAALAAEREAAEIVVGLPLTLRGEHGSQADATAEFVNQLQLLFTGPIHAWDERLTTAASQRALEEMGGSRRRKGRVDEVAATLMLQSYLDSRRA
jgi:putative Holliday junction resolvase